jgi:23S rRNA pseudouridine1911/1915/1917 synthase
MARLLARHPHRGHLQKVNVSPNPEERVRLVAPNELAPDTRLDRFLAGNAPGLSRSRVQALVAEGHVEVNGQTVTKPRHSVKSGDIITWTIPAPRPAETIAQDIPLEILHEDAHLAVLVKPSGLVVHPAAGNPDGTLVNALLHHFGNLSSIGGEERPGIVHRLDKETSGLMVVARDDATHQSLSTQFADREVKKIYLAVVHGVPDPPVREIRTSMGRHPVNRQKRAVLPDGQGKPAATDYHVLHVEQAGPSPTSLVRCDLHTGRTHQIRVHLHHCGHPIVGDPIYGNPRRLPKAERLLLHAYALRFRHPADGRPMAFTAPPPADFSPWRPAGGWPAV